MNTSAFKLLIMLLGSTVIICVVGGLVLTGMGKTVPDSIIGLGAGALGGLTAAFLRPPAADEGQPVPVQVMNKGAAEVVPVAEEGGE